MEMTISAVQLGASSQPQAKASDTGFSDVLTEVRTAAPQIQDYTAADSQSYAQDEAVQAEIPADVTVQAEMTAETFSVDFKETVIQLISGISGGDKEENDRIISALLEALKKMQDKSEDDSAVNLVMELLAAMLGDTKENVVFDFKFTSAETTVTAVNTELTAILSAEGDAAQQTAPEIPVQTTESAPVQPNAENRAAEIPVISAAEQTEIQSQPTEGYEKLLNDILAEARKELGLTKAEFTAETGNVQTESPVQTQKETAGMVLPFNHKDGTDELNSILGVTADDTMDSQQEIKPAPVIQDASAALTGNVPQQHTEAVTNEAPVQVEAPLPEQQLADEILSKPETINGGRTEFTMELNPESLGKITVRLVSTEGRVEVNITAENDATRQLLETRAENIGTALRNNGVELERYQVVSGQEEAQLMQESYDGSSRNPYGRNDEEQQNEDTENDFLEILQQL